MAKGKSRQRSVSSANPRSYSDYFKKDDGSLVEPAPQPQAKDVQQPRTSVDRTATWGAEYRQVVADLRQLLIISVLLFTVMIVLGLVV